MSDFTSGFWSIFISVTTVLSIVGTWIFLKMQTTRKLAPGEKAELMEHTWDGDLQDFNNPLPRWWLGLFYGTMIFSAAYLVLWPGLGSYAGLLGWSSTGEYEAEVKAAEAQFQTLYAGFLKQDIATVAANPEARAIGKNLFLTYCSQCHGSDAAGARGFPNLTDHDWLYGGDPTTIGCAERSRRMLALNTVKLSNKSEIAAILQTTTVIRAEWCDFQGQEHA